MRWSLLLLGIFLVSFPLYPGVDGSRVRRNDKDTGGLLAQILDALFSGKDDDVERTTTSDSNEDGASTDRETTSTPSTTATTVTSTTTTSTSTTARTLTTTQSLCKIPNDMVEANCSISDDFGEYMKWNLTANHLVGQVFSEYIINRLLDMCQPGDWCLSNDFIGDFASTMTDFYNSPICKTWVQDCIVDMLIMRNGCPDNLQLSVLSDALSLLCEMPDVPETTPECFGHVIATLHVTMADEIRATSKDIEFGGDEFCLGPYVGMTRKFMCTLDRCPNHNQLFKDFHPWQWFMSNAPTIKEVCDLTTVCGDRELEHAIEEEEEEEEEEGEETVLVSSTTYPSGQTKSEEEEEKIFEEEEAEEEEEEDEVNMAGDDTHLHGVGKPIFFIQTTDDSTRLLIGVVTGGLIGVLILMLLIGAIVKRIRRKYRYSTKDGYSKLRNQEFD